MKNNLDLLNQIDFSKLIKLTFSGDIAFSGRLILVGGKPNIQFEQIKNNKAFHTNYELEKAKEHITELLQNPSNLTVITEGITYSFKCTKKGTLLFNSIKNDRIQKSDEKNYLISPSLPVLFDLGITDKDSKIKNGMHDKFVQIDRFIQIIADTLKEKKITKGDSIKIIDSGCGKAYLSFAVYDYLTSNLGIDTSITGIDLKDDVVKKLQETAKKYGYKKMNFVSGNLKTADLKGYDMMISLHACDKATDYALYNAIKNDTEIILAVPCCQHEINEKFYSKSYNILNRHGIIKERISALMTDAVRASLLTYSGYKTKLIEFIDFDHSPKNIMIKAIKTNLSDKAKKEALTECENLLTEISSSQELYKLLTANADKPHKVLEDKN